MSQTAPRFAALLIAVLLVAAAAPTTAEPGKDPNGKSTEAPGQQEEKDHGHGQKADKEADPGPEPTGSESPTEPSQDWYLNLVIDDAAGIDQELLRMVREHLDAGVPVTLEPGENLTAISPLDLGKLANFTDSTNLTPQAPGAAEPTTSQNQAMSEEDCDLLILAIMKDPPFLDPHVRPECLPLSDIPTEKITDKIPTSPVPLPGQVRIHLD